MRRVFFSLSLLLGLQTLAHGTESDNGFDVDSSLVATNVVEAAAREISAQLENNEASNSEGSTIETDPADAGDNIETDPTEAGDNGSLLVDEQNQGEAAAAEAAPSIADQSSVIQAMRYHFFGEATTNVLQAIVGTGLALNYFFNIVPSINQGNFYKTSFIVTKMLGDILPKVFAGVGYFRHRSDLTLPTKEVLDIGSREQAEFLAHKYGFATALILGAAQVAAVTQEPYHHYRPLSGDDLMRLGKPGRAVGRAVGGVRGYVRAAAFQALHKLDRFASSHGLLGKALGISVAAVAGVAYVASSYQVAKIEADLLDSLFKSDYQRARELEREREQELERLFRNIRQEQRRQNANIVGIRDHAQSVAYGPEAGVINSDCSICLNDFAIGEHVTRFACGHGVHSGACHAGLVQFGHACPLCRGGAPAH